MADLTGEIALPERPRILVVDDDLAIGGTIKRYLRTYDVAVTDCVKGALEHLEEDRYDLMLLDRRLPDGLGDSVVEIVRKKRASLPIILMSGEVLPRRPDHHQPHQPDDFIEKPFVREALISKIERLLTAQAMRKHTQRQRAELAELHERRDRDVDVARTIFDRIFAHGQFDPAAIRHVVMPADRLAGDVVFGAAVADGRYRWMIGDVTGHTLSSALVTVLLARVFYRVNGDGGSLEFALDALEREIVAVLPGNMFCAGAMCELDRRAGWLQVWNGGNPDLVIRRAGGELTLIPSTSVPLGADRFAPPSHLVADYAVAPGDRIFAFSDGLLELRDRGDEPVGLARLLEIIRSGAAETVYDRLLALVPALVPDSPGQSVRDDDVSLIEVTV